MDAIATWLNNPSDYFSGLELLKAHTGESFTIQILSSGPDNFNTPKLYAELEKLQNKADEAKQIREEEKPLELKAKETNAGLLMDERAELKAQLRFLKDDAGATGARKSLAFRILDISKKLDLIFDEKEFYEQHGFVPSGEIELDDDPVQLQKRQHTLRTYITRYSKPGKSEEKLKEYQVELAIVDKKLERNAV